jgi:hypothetical protein
MERIKVEISEIFVVRIVSCPQICGCTKHLRQMFISMWFDDTLKNQNQGQGRSLGSNIKRILVDLTCHKLSDSQFTWHKCQTQGDEVSRTKTKIEGQRSRLYLRISSERKRNSGCLLLRHGLMNSQIIWNM